MNWRGVGEESYKEQVVSLQRAGGKIGQKKAHWFTRRVLVLRLNKESSVNQRFRHVYRHLRGLRLNKKSGPERHLAMGLGA